MSKAYLLLICLLSASFTGCIIENDSSTYGAYEAINFNGSFAPESDQDNETMNEFLNNIIGNGSFENVQNITWEKYEHKFVIQSDWEIKYVVLTMSVVYELGVGEQPSEGPAGTLDFSLIDPTGGEHGEGYEIVTWNNPVNERLLVLPQIYGTWTIKISGSGLEGAGALVYSGNYDITVETRD